MIDKQTVNGEDLRHIPHVAYDAGVAMPHSSGSATIRRGSSL